MNKEEQKGLELNSKRDIETFLEKTNSKEPPNERMREGAKRFAKRFKKEISISPLLNPSLEALACEAGFELETTTNYRTEETEYLIFLSLVQEYLRNEKGIEITIFKVFGLDYYRVYANSEKGIVWNPMQVQNEVLRYQTYKEALENALFEVLQIILKK